MADTRNCFAYGTLMCPEIMQTVAGGRFRSSAAVLDHYARYRVEEETYPAIVEAGGRMVQGLIYFAVPEAAWRRLDEFEGEYYARTPVKVRLQDNRVATAEAYVMRPEYRHLLTDQPWDLATFRKSGQTRFEASYLGFAQLQELDGAG